MSRSASTEDIHAHMLRRSGVPHMNTLKCLPENISCTNQWEQRQLHPAEHPGALKSRNGSCTSTMQGYMLSA